MQIQSPLISKIVQTDRWRKEEMFMNKGRIYTFLNPVSYLFALKNLDVFAAFDGMYSDGSLLVAAIRVLYHKKIWRQSFDMTSLAPKLFNFADKNSCSVCIVASKQEKLDIGIVKLSKLYPKIKWSLCRNGYFETEDEKNLYIDKIVKSQPYFLIVGMGCGKQEEFLLECKKKGYSGIGFTCGGFIHQFADNQYIQYYPKWIDKWNIRFIYRFLKERHTRKRYIIAAFVFPYSFTKEKLLHLLS